MPHAHRATRRQNVGRRPATGRRRPTLPSQAAPRARTAVARPATAAERLRIARRRRPTTGRRTRPSRIG